MTNAKSITQQTFERIFQRSKDSIFDVKMSIKKYAEDAESGKTEYHNLPSFISITRSQNAELYQYFGKKLAENKLIGHKHVIALDMQAGKTEMMMFIAFLCHLTGHKINWHLIVWHEQKALIAQLRRKFKEAFDPMLDQQEMNDALTFFDTEYLTSHIITRNEAKKRMHEFESIEDTIFLLDEDDFAIDLGRKVADFIDEGMMQTQAQFMRALHINGGFEKRNNTLFCFSATNPVRVCAAVNCILNATGTRWSLFAPQLPAKYWSIAKLIHNNYFHTPFTMVDWEKNTSGSYDGFVSAEGKKLIKDHIKNPDNRGLMAILRLRGDDVEIVQRYIQRNFSGQVRFFVFDANTKEKDPNKVLGERSKLPIIAIIRLFMSRGNDLDGDIKKRIVLYHNGCGGYDSADLQRIRLTGYDSLHPRLKIYADVETMHQYVLYMDALRNYSHTGDVSYISNLHIISSKHFCRNEKTGEITATAFRHADLRDTLYEF